MLAIFKSIFCSFNSIFYSSVGEGSRQNGQSGAGQWRQARSLTHLGGQVFFFLEGVSVGVWKWSTTLKTSARIRGGWGGRRQGGGVFFADMEDQVKKKKNFQHLRCDDNRVTRLFCFVLCPSLESDQLWSRKERREREERLEIRFSFFISDMPLWAQDSEAAVGFFSSAWINEGF